MSLLHPGTYLLTFAWMKWEVVLTGGLLHTERLCLARVLQCPSGMRPKAGQQTVLVRMKRRTLHPSAKMTHKQSGRGVGWVGKATIVLQSLVSKLDRMNCGFPQLIMKVLRFYYNLSSTLALRSLCLNQGCVFCTTCYVVFVICCAKNTWMQRQLTWRIYNFPQLINRTDDSKNNNRSAALFFTNEMLRSCSKEAMSQLLEKYCFAAWMQHSH